MVYRTPNGHGVERGMRGSGRHRPAGRRGAAGRRRHAPEGRRSVRMTVPLHDDAARLELRVLPDAALVATVRRFVGDLSSRVIIDREITSRVTVATHELLDNATRYSSDGCLLLVELKRAGNEAGVVIVTENQVNEDHQRQLARLVEEMRASSDSSAYYRDLIRQVAQRKDGAGLGLGRVHAESELAVSSTFEGDVVRIRAEGRFSLTTGAALR